ncbi:plasmid partitioning protein RepB C-terminal domain-containing protein (plasmid) [Paraburkholderia sp. FT54]|uniref:plasmid partitioning protein RepB C-terminal domain-containing protein n=1 Tax=Paraburkholderia sp. FT54 TaxID=3074437 RepID=UPI002877912F|nr:plasmid partitioning protein RepB C-terminal domain-containing protein [Paraburkholderia sp. FT54]WNC95570.1 plasmid partitioning protein RepB C-terminal domain-containing protein [Paraburkholderia sp. FT54]
MNDRIDKSTATLMRSDEVSLIPVCQLRVLNPRTRNPYLFAQLVENIATIGLKRPITVAYGGRDDSGVWHEVLCGQGRLEALKALGEEMIPCCVVEADQIERFLITLAENLARRRHTTEELLSGLQVLRSKGYSTEQIARKTNLDPSYINGILHLLDNGEQRLLRAVERKVVPMWLAMDIARSSSEEVQVAMVSAYEQGTLKGEQLMRVRKIISMRDAVGKAFHSKKPQPKDKPTPQKLLKTYQTEVRRKKMVVQNARIQEQRLLIITSALKKFLGDEHFRTLLRAENVRDIPEAVASRIPPELLP